MIDIEILLGQNRIINKILHDFGKESKVFIHVDGISGSGKSFIAKKVQQTWEMHDRNITFFINGDDFYSSREYYPFFIGLADRKEQLLANKTALKSLVELAKGIPFAGDFVSHIISNVSEQKQKSLISKYPYLTSIELDIIFKLQYLVEENNLLLIADNFHWFDKASLNFLSLIYSGKLFADFPFLNQIKILVITTKDQDYTNSDDTKIFISKNLNAYYSIKQISFDKYKKVLALFGLQVKLSNELYKLLFSFTGSHIELIKNIVAFVKDSTIEGIEYIAKNITESSFYAEEILSMRLNSYGMTGEQIKDVLEQASIIGLNFTFEELGCLTNKRKHILEPVLKNAAELNLIESQKNKLQFTHEILKNIFTCKAADKKAFYHNSFANCLRILKPGDYVSRANHLFEAGSLEDSIILYIVAYFKSLRNGINYSPIYKNRILTLCEKYINEYLKIMNKAYSAYNKKQYESTISLLASLEENYPKLLIAEKDYLLSICLAKSPRQKDRMEAKNILETWDEIKNEESEVWTRLMSTLMIINIHLELFDEAKKIEKKLMLYLTEREKFDPNALDGINVLRRKSQSLHISEVAIQRTLKSLEYFGPKENSKIPMNPIEYYMALSNHAGNEINQGDFENSHCTSLLALNLIKNYPMLNFPRHEIPINNFIVSGILSENLELQNGIDLYEQLFENKKKYADYILLLNNQAILHALNNDLTYAEKIINVAVNFIESESCIDSYYEYYIGINKVIMFYFLDKVSLALREWEYLDKKIPNIPDIAFLLKRHQLIGNYLKNTKKINTTEWFNALILENPFELGKAWNFFGKGYLFSDLQFWSES